MATAMKGDIVKFVGIDGKSCFTKVVDIVPTPDFSFDYVLEMQGRDKGRTGAVNWRDVKWNGKQFIADLREGMR